MKIRLVLIALLTASISFSQMRPIDKVYIVEGVVADIETLKGIPSAVLYNDSLGIIATSDEKGYFKLVVPLELIMKRQIISIYIMKASYKHMGFGISYTPTKADTIHPDTSVIWNTDVQISWMAKNESKLSPTGSAHIRSKEGIYNASVILQSFQEAVASKQKVRKIEALKKGNEKVFFIIDGKAAIAGITGAIFFDNASPIIFINNKRVKLSEINNQLKRSQTHVNWPKSDSLSKLYGKDAIVFTIDN